MPHSQLITFYGTSLKVIKLVGMAMSGNRSGIDTIKYHTRLGTRYRKVTKSQENITLKRAKRSAPSQQMTTRLQETDKTVWQRQTQKKYPQ